MLAPPRPRPTLDRPPPAFYTIHSRPNNAFTMKLSEDTKTSIVGFKSYDAAYFVGQMVETNYTANQEWPNTDVTSGKIYLPRAPPDLQLSLLVIQGWDFDDLKLYCTSNLLDMISVDEITSGDGSFSFSGDRYSFSAPTEFYADRFNQILALEQ
jgi:hypothetical protein